MRGYAQTARAVNPARERLIAEHVDMARRIAVRVGRRTPDWVSEDDLVSAAMIGLAEAADRFEAERGEPFVAFAEKRIRGAVLDELRRGDLMSRRARTAARRVGKIIRQLEHALGRRPEDEEIAAALGVSLEHYRDELEMLTHVGFVELGPSEEDGRASEEIGPSADAEKRQLVERLQVCLQELAPRDAQVLSLYYVEDLSYAEIGEILGVSESRVCQLHSRALIRLRTEFTEMEEE